MKFREACDSNIVDIDLDCPESNLLADAFLNATAMEFGKQSTPRAHRLYKVIDLNKKHTRTPFAFEDVTKSMLVELRALVVVSTNQALLVNFRRRECTETAERSAP